MRGSRVASVLPAPPASESCFETSGVGRSIIPVEATRVEVSQIQHAPRFDRGTQMGVEAVASAMVSSLTKQADPVGCNDAARSASTVDQACAARTVELVL